jgi:hypothetical protein
MTTLARCRPLALACVGALVIAGHSASASEKKVYRCGQTYQQVPCPAEAGASGQAINANDPRSAEQRADARAAAAADKRQAKALAAERQQREKAIRPQQSPMGTSLKPGEPPASAPETGAPKTHAKKHKKKASEPDRYVPPSKPPTGKG